VCSLAIGQRGLRRRKVGRVTATDLFGAGHGKQEKQELFWILDFGLRKKREKKFLETDCTDSHSAA
jgi:hypothetical protein